MVCMKIRWMLLSLLAVPVSAEEEPSSLDWELECHADLPQAAAIAKNKNARILIGLAGAPT